MSRESRLNGFQARNRKFKSRGLVQISVGGHGNKCNALAVSTEIPAILDHASLDDLFAAPNANAATDPRNGTTSLGDCRRTDHSLTYLTTMIKALSLLLLPDLE